MENKAPVKKVLLRKEDEFYIYDKRINKCSKEDCDGTVKYGLNLQVQMPMGDTLNTYECNKCHMKYTAYPNYVRLKDSKHIHIFNYDEVRERNKKRRDEARKLERKKAGFKHKPFGAKKFEHPFEKKKSYEKRYNETPNKHNYKVTTIGGYHKNYNSVFGEDKRIVVED
jgi:hypothetical protein